MAYYAEIGPDGAVQRVLIVADEALLDANGQEDESLGATLLSDITGKPGPWVRTDPDGVLRGRFAAVGDRYDQASDAFIAASAVAAPVPQWTQFGAALAADPGVNAMVASAASSAPVLHLMLGVGLGQAAQGSPQTFSVAWSTARSTGLVSVELAEHVAGIGANFDLPPEFIAQLQGG